MLSLSKYHGAWGLARLVRVRCRSDGDDGVGLPWTVGKYYTKKLERRTNKLGEILQTPETIAEPIGWNDNAKLELSVELVSRETGVPIDEVKSRVRQLQEILPDFGERHLKTVEKVKLALDIESVIRRVIRLKEMLPNVDASALVLKRPSLLSQDSEIVQKDLDTARKLLADAGGVENFENLVEVEPSILNVELLDHTLRELERLFLGKKSAKLLESNPQWIWKLQSLTSQSRGDRDEAYVLDTYGKGKKSFD
ncbi:hypothetical protein BSKO_13562 [Bryopsis sp. KO-2023]|nr:hypothetical protein BSKO_13562 [Bryopsis sp. KO-2023]